jgi:nucleotide-binding universal stress UspA family protein
MPLFKHILATTDFSGASQDALVTAGQLASGANAKVTLIHVYDPTPLGPALAYLRKSQVADEARARADSEMRRELERTRSEALGDVELVELALVEDSSPALAVSDYAKSHDIDLVVVGTHGHTSMSRWLIGSVAEKVVRRAPCSVLVVRPKRAGEGALYHKMLVGTDFSPGAEPALDGAAAWARMLGASATLAYCYDTAIPMVPPVGVPEALDTRELADENIADLREALANLAEARLSGVRDVDSVVLESRNAADSLTSYADERGYDLIVVGAQGRTGRDRVLVGGVAEKVLRHASCSVLAVRTQSEGTDA